MQTLTLKISGMACGGCANTVKQALLALEGVSTAEVSHVEAGASVIFDAQKIAPSQIAAAVTAAGYPAQRLTS